MNQQVKTFHFWLAYIMGAAGVVNSSNVIPVNSQVHVYIGLGVSLLGLLAYQLGYQATPPNNNGGSK